MYAQRRSIRLGNQLGFGRDGTVLASSSATAIKVFVRRDPYQRELECYRRIESAQVVDILGFNVPRLIAFDDELMVIEMGIVQRPFLLDFAGAHLDIAPDFPPEVLEDWRKEKLEQFGDRWPDVEAAIAWLGSRLGIHLLDIHPGNIAFEGPESGEQFRAPDARPH